MPAAPCAQEAWRPIVSVALAWIVVAFLGIAGFVAAAVALLLYVVILTLLRGMSWADVELMRELFADRMADKADMLRRLRAGTAITHIPNPDADPQNGPVEVGAGNHGLYNRSVP